MILTDGRPVIAAKARLRFDRLSGRMMLLYPERGLALSESAAAILELCDARHTVAEIVDALAIRTQGDRATIASDVSALLESLAERGLVQWKSH